MFRTLILCLFLSAQSCNLDDNYPKADAGEDTTKDVVEDIVETSEGCLNYCEKVANTCVDDNALYTSTEACYSACSLFIDRPDAAGAFTGDTLQCRIYHINAAASNPNIHCPHGSAASVPQKCQDFQTLCSTYCGELSELCVQDFEADFAAEGIATLQNCINSCPGQIPKDGEAMADDTTDTVNCRLSQLTKQNCAGGKVDSDVCVDPFVE